MAKLTLEDIKAALTGLDGWALVEGREALHKRFEFKNFVEAFGFMTQAALISEKMNHHPEWFNVYRTIDVTLATHDANGITELDLKLAKEMNRIARL